MTQATNVQQRFSGGELDDELYERYEIDQYEACIGDSLNVMSTNKGDLIARPGTKFYRSQGTAVSDPGTRIIPFVFSNDEKFILEFSHLKLKIFRGNTQITSTTRHTFDDSQFDPNQDGSFYGGGEIRHQFPFQVGDVFTINSDKTGTAPTVTLDPGAIAVTLGTDTFEIASIDWGENNDYIVDKIGIYEEGQTTLLNVNLGASTIAATMYFEFTQTEFQSPYTTDDLQNIQFDGAGDIMFFTDGVHQPMKLSRIGGINSNDFLFHPHFTLKGPWRPFATYGERWLTTTEPANAGFYWINSQMRATPDALGGKKIDPSVLLDRKVRFASLRDDFVVKHVYIDAIIDEVNETDDILNYFKVRNAVVANQLSITAPPPQYNPGAEINEAVNTIRIGQLFEEPQSDGTGGWPKTVTIWDNRLIYGNSPEFPTTIAASAKGDFDNFSPDDRGFGGENENDRTNVATAPEVRDTDAFVYSLDDVRGSEIVWLKGTPRGLMAATEASVHVSNNPNRNAGYSATNFQMVLASHSGAAPVQPVFVDGRVYYVGDKRNRVHSLGYEFQSDVYASVWESVFSDNLLSGQIQEMVFARDPIQVIWMRTGDSQLISMVLLKEQGQVGFFKHKIGGPSGFNNEIFSICVKPSEEEPYYDQLMLNVLRPTVCYPSLEGLSRYPIDTDIHLHPIMDMHETADGIEITECTRSVNALALTIGAHSLTASDVVGLGGFTGSWSYLNGHGDWDITLVNGTQIFVDFPGSVETATTTTGNYNGHGLVFARETTTPAITSGDSRYGYTPTLQEKLVNLTVTTHYTLAGTTDYFNMTNQYTGRVWAIGWPYQIRLTTLPNIQNNQLGQSAGFLANMSELVFSILKTRSFTVERTDGTIAIEVTEPDAPVIDGSSLEIFTGKYQVRPEQVEGDLDGSLIIRPEQAKPFRLRALYKRGERATR